MKVISLLPILGGSLLVCFLFNGPETPASSENVQNVLEDLDGSWGRAVINGNWEEVQSILADDFIEIDFQGRVLNKSQDVEQIKSDTQRLKHPTYEASEYVVRVLNPTTAVMIHQATSTGERDGKQFSETHRSMHVFIKRGDRWQALATQETPIKE